MLGCLEDHHLRDKPVHAEAEVVDLSKSQGLDEADDLLGPKGGGNACRGRGSCLLVCELAGGPVAALEGGGVRTAMVVGDEDSTV